MTTYTERTANRTILLISDNLFDGPEDCIVLQIEDRFGQKIHPDTEETERNQAWIDDRLKHYKSRRKLDRQEPICPHGLGYSVCTICPDEGRHDYA